MDHNKHEHHQQQEMDHGNMDHSKMPVSYTHLRAHETVLDLVCRLLLEKKKNKKNKKQKKKKKKSKKINKVTCTYQNNHQKSNNTL